jgi:hypothetical protein
MAINCNVVTMCFWTLKIALFLFKTMFGRLYFVFVCRWNLFSWAQSVELVPVSGEERR